jgi:hypothetical protein
MRDLLTLTIHLLVTCIKLLRPGGVRPVAPVVFAPSPQNRCY